MRRWFLSYHSTDQALAERLKSAIERKAADAHVFFAPSNLRVGGFWSRALAEEIAKADVFVLLVGEAGVGRWQELEYDEALDKRVQLAEFPIILILLEGQSAPGLPFLRRLHWIVTADPSSEKDVARLLDAAAVAAPGSESSGVTRHLIVALLRCRRRIVTISLAVPGKRLMCSPRLPQGPSALWF